MDFALIGKAILLGIVEGVTEFLPVSSTGHLILVNQFIEFTDNFAPMFDIVIQLGAILAVIVYFWKRLIPSPSSPKSEQKAIINTWLISIIGVIPALIIGGIAGDFIEEKLFNAKVVAIALVLGGILLIIIERTKKVPKILEISQITIPIALGIGLIQCIAMVPGTSRSAATILGAMALGTSRAVAAEYSFFLAIPTIAAASAYSLLKTGFELTTMQWIALAVGFTVSFFVAWAVIAAFMNYIRKRNFLPFAYYRIGLGIIVFVYFFFFNAKLPAHL